MNGQVESARDQMEGLETRVAADGEIQILITGDDGEEVDLARYAATVGRQARRAARLGGAVGLAVLLAGCTGTTAASVATLPTAQAPVAALPDHASAAQTRTIRSVVQQALTAEVAVFDTDERGAPTYTAAERNTMIATVETLLLAAKTHAALAHSLGQPPFRGGGRFVVERWQGMQVVGASARVYLTGHNAYTPTSTDGQRRDATAQYRLLVIRAHGLWLVTSERIGMTDQG